MKKIILLIALLSVSANANASWKYSESSFQGIDLSSAAITATYDKWQRVDLSMSCNKSDIKFKITFMTHPFSSSDFHKITAPSFYSNTIDNWDSKDLKVEYRVDNKTKYSVSDVVIETRAAFDKRDYDTQVIAFSSSASNRIYHEAMYGQKWALKVVTSSGKSKIIRSTLSGAKEAMSKLKQHCAYNYQDI